MRAITALSFLALLAIAWTSSAQGETAAGGSLRVSFAGSLSPKALPRQGSAPISVRIGGRISTTDGTDPPPLQTIEIALNRSGRLNPKALPICRIDLIQPATTEEAIRACKSSKVGDGSFSAAVAIPGQAPFPSLGQVTAFNGRKGGHPVILLHIYGTEPVPTSLTVPLGMSRGKGSFGLVLRGSLPSVSSNIGFVTGVSLRLGNRRRSHPYLSAGCPAPKGFSGAVFPLVRASFAFADGRTLRSTLVRSCRAQG